MENHILDLRKDMESDIMDFMFWTPLFSIFAFLFAIAIPVILLIVLVVWILNHRDNVQASASPAGEARKLYKSETDKMLAGVCGGIAEYFHIDSTLVRIALVFFTFCGGSGILLYIIAAIAMPHRPGPTAV
jgi:phage shock protein PspC (stress-responsive transcriptional regulator)